MPKTPRSCEQQSFRSLITRLCGLTLVAVVGTAAAQTDPRALAAENRGDGSGVVDPFTRVMRFEVPLGSVPGRGGLAVPIGLRYSSRVWSAETNTAASQGGAGNPRALFRADTGWAQLSTCADLGSSGSAGLSNFVFNGTTGEPLDIFEDRTSPRVFVNRHLSILPSGEVQEFRSSDRTDGVIDPDSVVRRAVDGSGAVFSRPEGSDIVQFASGTVIGGAHCILDANGNFIDRKDEGFDSFGRTVPVPRRSFFLTDLSDNRPNFESAPGDYPLDIAKVGGGTNRTVIRIQRLADVRIDPATPLRRRTSAAFNPATNTCRIVTDGFLFNSPAGCGTGAFVSRDELFNPPLIGEIVLANGLKYVFRYNVFGELARITLPTGAVQEFEYAELPPRSGMAQSVPSFLNQTNRGVVRATLKVAGQPDAVTRYERNAVHNPDGTRIETTYIESADELIAFGFDDPRVGLALEQRQYGVAPAGRPASEAPLLRRTLFQYAHDGTRDLGPVVAGRQSIIYRIRNVRPIRTTALSFDGTGDVLSSSVRTEYLPRTDIVLPSASIEHEHVTIARATAATIAIDAIPVGTVARRTETDYLSDARYTARNILGLPTAVRVKDAAGRILSEQRMAYDEADMPILGYGTGGTMLAISGWSDPGATRGNLTSLRNCTRATPTTSPCADQEFVRQRFRYDQFGNIVETTDNSGNVTKTEYAAAQAYAFVTKIITPAPRDLSPNETGRPLSTIGLATSLEVDFATGLTTAVIGPNGHDADNTVIAGRDRTSTQYQDPLNRVTRIVGPDGSYVATEYVESDINNLFVRERSPIDQRETFTDTVVDALGRVRKTLTYPACTSGPDCDPIVSATFYDAFGRIVRTTQPHFERDYLSTPGCTPGQNSCTVQTDRVPATTFAYDALGRLIETKTLPDGAATATQFGENNVVTVTDAAGKRRSARADALGNVVAVTEDPLGQRLDTSYVYDVLGNLREVRQGEQRRYFAFDAASRLIRMRIPEQEVNANIAAHTDPISNNAQWTAEFGYDANSNLIRRVDARDVSTTFAYDRFNRLTETRYSDGTPTRIRRYDDLADRATTFGRGRLTLDYTENTSGDGRDTTTATYFLDRNPAGRITRMQTEFRQAGGRSVAFTVHQSYLLGGAVARKTLPSGRTQTFSYDGFGRLLNTDGTLGGEPTRRYAANIRYNAASAMVSETLGTSVPLFYSRDYNSRLQLCRVRLGTSAAGNDYGFLNIQYTSDGSTCTSDAANNGNVYGVSQNIGGVGYAQFFTYDALNRLATISDRTFLPSANQPTVNFTRSYSYDRYGNRSIGADDIRDAVQKALLRQSKLAHASADPDAPSVPVPDKPLVFPAPAVKPQP